MTSFHDVLFPIPLSLGATGGPERRTEIVQLSSGREQRNARTALSRRRYDVGTALRSLDDLYLVMEFFEARRGPLFAFRLRDPFDMKSSSPAASPGPMDQEIGTGDGAKAVFPILKRYGMDSTAYLRPITRARASGIRVAVDGDEVEADAAYVAGPANITFQPGHVPVVGALVTVGFEFDVPVRFDIDRIELNLAAFKAGQIPTIPLVEVIE